MTPPSRPSAPSAPTSSSISLTSCSILQVRYQTWPQASFVIMCRVSDLIGLRSDQVIFGPSSLSLTDQLAPLDSSGNLDALKPPATSSAPLQPPGAPSHSVGSLQYQSHLQPPGPSAQLHGLSHSHSLPPPYKSHSEDLNKEDVIFF